MHLEYLTEEVADLTSEAMRVMYEDAKLSLPAAISLVTKTKPKLRQEVMGGVSKLMNLLPEIRRFVNDRHRELLSA